MTVNGRPIALRNSLWLSLLLVLGTLGGTIAQAQDAPAIETIDPPRLSPPQRQQRQETIARMTTVEREKLKRNWATFQGLSDADKNRYRLLHRELEAEPALKKTLQTYHNWLLTLTPGQRQQLRDEKDASRRIAIVIRWKDEQEKAHEVSPIERAPIDLSRLRRPMRGGFFLENADSAQLLQVVLAGLTDPQKKQLEAVSPAERATRSIELSIKNSGGYNTWPNEELQKALLGAITQQATRARVEELKQPTRRLVLATMVGQAAARLVLDEMKQQIPDQDRLQAVFENLDSERRHDLMQMPPDALTRELVQEYFQSHPSPEAKRAQALLQTLGELRNRFDPFPLLGGPRGGRPDGRGPWPNGRPGDPGGRFDRRGPPGGGPPFRGPGPDRDGNAGNSPDGNPFEGPPPEGASPDRLPPDGPPPGPPPEGIEASADAPERRQER